MLIVKTFSKKKNTNNNKTKKLDFIYYIWCRVNWIKKNLYLYRNNDAT